MRRKLPRRELVLWRRRTRRWAGPLVLVLALAVAGYAIHSELADIRLEDISAGFRALSAEAILISFAFTAISFASLVGYDFSAFRYFGIKAPPARLIVGSFCGYAIANTAGFAILTGASARYRIHAPSGLSLVNAGRIALFCALAFGAGVSLTGAVGLILEPDALTSLLGMPRSLVVAIGWAMLVSLVGVLAFAGFGRPVPLGRWSFRLPSLQMSLAQLAFCVADIVFAAAALYVLLPVRGEVGYPEFLAVYCAALAAGILSHVPGGVGVFDAVILAAFAERTGAGALVAGLLAFRIVYYMVPFFLALLTLAYVELKRHGRRARTAFPKLSGLGTAMAPTLAAGVALAGACLMLVSGAVPALSGKLDTLGTSVPLWMIEGSHFLTALIAGWLAFLAFGLARRLEAAFRLTFVLLLVAAALAILRDLAWWEAGSLAGAALILRPLSFAFRRSTRLFAQPPSAPWLIGFAFLLGLATWITLFAFRHVGYDFADAWLVFELEAEPARALRALAAAYVSASLVAIAFLTRPAAPEPSARPGPAEIARAMAIVGGQDRAGANLVATGDKALRFSESGRAFLMYAVRGRSWISLGDPVGPREERLELVWRFREAAYAAHARPVFYQVGGDMLPAYIDAGLDLVKLGEEARVPLAEFSLQGRTRQNLRTALSRARREGLSFEMVAPGASGPIMPQLGSVSRAWLAARGSREKAFSLGRFDPAYLKACEIALVTRAGEPVAFANVLSTGTGAEATIDLMRAAPDAPPATMEFLFASLIEALKARGIATFSLGMAPLSGLTDEDAPGWHRLGAFVFEYGNRFYNFQGIRRFKEQFGPDWEPRYLAIPGGVDPLLALVDVAALISGGGPLPKSGGSEPEARPDAATRSAEDIPVPRG